MLSYHEAFAVLTAARSAVEAESFNAAVVVVDAAGNDLAVARSEASSSFTADVARGKARTAARFGRPSVDVDGLAERFPDVFAIATETVGLRAVTLDGGVPLRRAGVVVGAIGVSGGTPEADRRCADSGAAALTTP
jgi:glc operon protein GlcG